VGMFLLLSPVARTWFRPDEQARYLLTGFFSFYILMAAFNAFNARTEKMNLFENIGQNTGFIKVIALIVAVQVAMTYLGGAVLRCYGLTLSEWGVVILAAFTIIPVDIIRKAIVGRRKLQP